MQCTSNKKSFETEAKANEWVRFWNEVISNGKELKKLTYSYHCHECGKWHTTKHSKIKINYSIISERIRAQNKMIEIALNDIVCLRSDIKKQKQQLHDKENHLKAILKTNKTILEKLNEV